MGTVFSSQSPHKLFDQIFSALKANEKYITIDLNEHYIPNHKQYDMEHYIQQTCSLHQINALMNMPPEVQAKKIATIQKTLKAARSKSSGEFFGFEDSEETATLKANADLCFKCSKFLSYETNGTIIRATTKCSNPTLEPVVVELNISSGRLAIVRDINLGTHYMTVDDIEEIKQIAGPSSGLTYEASQLVTKKTSATKKQVAIVGLDKGYRTWFEDNDVKIGLYQQPEPDAEEDQVDNDDTESNATDAASTSSSKKRKARRPRKFVPRKRARMPSVLDSYSIVIMDYNDFEERGLDRKDLIEVFRVQPGLYKVTSFSETLRLEDRHGLAVHLTRIGDVIEEDEE
jgi:hypothetical protein